MSAKPKQPTPLESFTTKAQANLVALCSHAILRGDDKAGREVITECAGIISGAIPQWDQVVRAVADGGSLVESLVAFGLAGAFVDLRNQHPDPTRTCDLARAIREAHGRLSTLAAVEASLVKCGHISPDTQAALAASWGEQSSATLTTRDLGDWQELADQEPEYVFTGAYALERGILGTIAAVDGGRKSIFALHLCLSAVSGRTLLRGFNPAGPMKVLYLSAEDSPAQMSRRLKSIYHAYENVLPSDGLSCLKNFHLPERDPGVLFAESNNGAVTWSDGGRKWVKSLHGYDIAFVDTWAAYGGLKGENDNSSMGAAGRLLQLAAAEAKCAIVVVHHSSKAAKSNGDDMGAELRGASALSAARRWGIYLSAKPGGIILARHTKASYQFPGPAFELEAKGAALVAHFDPAGAAVRDAIIKLIEIRPPLKSELLHQKRKTEARKILDNMTGMDVAPCIIQSVYDSLVDEGKIRDESRRNPNMQGGTPAIYVVRQTSYAEDEEGECPF